MRFEILTPTEDHNESNKVSTDSTLQCSSAIVFKNRIGLHKHFASTFTLHIARVDLLPPACGAVDSR